jgi:hypothetical protein
MSGDHRKNEVAKRCYRPLMNIVCNKICNTNLSEYLNICGPKL